jgi:hypothetical protein
MNEEVGDINMLLEYVSLPLRAEISFELYTPMYNAHPFFCKYGDRCPQVMQRVCHTATSITRLTAGDVLFHAGETPTIPGMYIMIMGKMQYTSSNLGEDSEVTESSNNIISEATIWCNWKHRGALIAVSDSRLLFLEARKFQVVVSAFLHPDIDPVVYGTDFVLAMNELGKDATDLTTPVKKMPEYNKLELCESKKFFDAKMFFQRMKSSSTSNQSSLENSSSQGVSGASEPFSIFG